MPDKRCICRTLADESPQYSAISDEEPSSPDVRASDQLCMPFFWANLHQGYSAEQDIPAEVDKRNKLDLPKHHGPHHDTGKRGQSRNPITLGPPFPLTGRPCERDEDLGSKRSVDE